MMSVVMNARFELASFEMKPKGGLVNICVLILLSTAM